MGLDRKVIGEFNGVIDSLSDTGISCSMVDVSNNKLSHVCFNRKDYSQDLYSGYHVRITCYEHSDRVNDMDVEFTPAPELTEADHERADILFP